MFDNAYKYVFIKILLAPSFRHLIDLYFHVCFVCRCAKVVKDKKYTHFAIQDFSECWSGPNAASSYDKYGSENVFIPKIEPRPVGCMDANSNKCDTKTLNCIGMSNTNFVYGLEGGIMLCEEE